MFFVTVSTQNCFQLPMASILLSLLPIFYLISFSLSYRNVYSLLLSSLPPFSSLFPSSLPTYLLSFSSSLSSPPLTCVYCIPFFYSLIFILSLLQLERVGRQHQAGSDSYITGAAFFKIKEVKCTTTQSTSLQRC